MTTPRRNLLAAIFAAPVIAATRSATAAPLPDDMADLGMADLLRIGSKVSDDARLAELCALAIPAYEASERALALYHDARATAEAMAPFPSALLIPRVFTHASGEVEHYSEQWRPAGDRGGWVLHNLAFSQLRASLGRQPTHGEMRTQEAAMRAQWDAWSEVNRQAQAACLLSDLHAAADATDDAFAERYSAIMAHRPRSLTALHVKCWLRWADPPADGVDVCHDMARDVQAALS